MHPRIPTERIRSGLFFATLEAVVVGGMLACTDFWLVPLVQHHLGAAAWLVGLMAVLPQLANLSLGPLARPIIAFLGGNKRASLWLCWLQIACLAALLLPASHPQAAWALPVGLGVVVLFGMTGCIIAPAWLAWMGDLVPARLRGRYTSRRTRLFVASRLACTLLFAWLARCSPLGESSDGIVLILGLAALSRLVSTWCQMHQAELPPRQPRPGASARSAAELPPFTSFLAGIHRHPAGQWMLVWCLVMVGVNVAGPFFASYAIAPRDSGGLGLADFSYALLFQVSWITRLLIYPAVGRLVDRHGARAVLRMGLLGIIFVPLPWVLTQDWWALVAGEVLSGICWALAESALGVLLMSSHPSPAPRAQLAGWFFALAGGAMVLGSGLGTLLMRYPVLPELGGSPYRTLFLVSMLLRLPAVLLALRLLPSFKEGRHLGAELWQLIPGVELVITVGRGVVGRGLLPLLRREDDEAA